MSGYEIVTEEYVILPQETFEALAPVVSTLCPDTFIARDRCICVHCLGDKEKPTFEEYRNYMRLVRGEGK